MDHMPITRTTLLIALVLVALCVVGYLATRSQSQVRTVLPQTGQIQVTTVPTTSIESPSPQTWETLRSDVLGTSIEYPRDISHMSQGSASSLIYPSPSTLQIRYGMGYIVQISRHDPVPSVETWIRAQTPASSVITQTTLAGRPAYHIEVRELQQVPTDSYVIPLEDRLIEIQYMSAPTLGEYGDACATVECQQMVVESIADYTSRKGPIVRRILESIRVME